MKLSGCGYGFKSPRQSRCQTIEEKNSLKLGFYCINYRVKWYVTFPEKKLSFHNTLSFTIKVGKNFLFVCKADLGCVCMSLCRGSGRCWRREKAGRSIQRLCWRKSSHLQCETRSWSQTGKWAAPRPAWATRTPSETLQSSPWPNLLQLQS